MAVRQSTHIPPGVARIASTLTRLFERSAAIFLDRLSKGAADHQGLRRLISRLEGPIGLYIHVPFCHQPLCRFCCFVRYPYSAEQARLYRRAVLQEIEEQASLAEAAQVETIYVGGGTPSMDPELLAEILDRAREAWGARSATVSVEASPRDVTDSFVHALRGLVDRLSIGAQALTPERLRRLGRLNTTVEDVARAVEAARGRFPTVNLDMVWGLPGEGPEETRREARRALALGLDQVTFYPIMPTPATRREIIGRGGPWSPWDPENYAAILEEAAEAGYRPSTPWCMSRREGAPIDEYIVDTPWFIAAGPSGITRLPGLVAANAFRVEHYARLVEARGLAARYAVAPSQLEDALYVAESMLFGLRWSPRLLATRYGETGAAIAAYVSASLVLLGERPGPEGGWLLEKPTTLYALHRAQHILYTALAWFRHEVLAREAAEAAKAPATPITLPPVHPA